MVTYLTEEEAQKLICPFGQNSDLTIFCVVGKCHAWEWIRDPWQREQKKGLCALCHKEGK